MSFTFADLWTILPKKIAWQYENISQLEIKVIKAESSFCFAISLVPWHWLKVKMWFSGKECNWWFYEIALTSAILRPGCCSLFCFFLVVASVICVWLDPITTFRVHKPYGFCSFYFPKDTFDAQSIINIIILMVWLQHAAEFKHQHQKEVSLSRLSLSIHPSRPQTWDATFWKKKKAEWLTASLYIEIFNIHRRTELQKKPSNYASKEGIAKCTIFASDTQFCILWELCVGFEHWCPCSLKHLWKIRAEIQVGFSAADHPHQRARAVLPGSVDQSTSLNTNTPRIAEGSPFHKEHNSLETRTMTKNSPEKQIFSENDPISF